MSKSEVVVYCQEPSHADRPHTIGTFTRTWVPNDSLLSGDREWRWSLTVSTSGQAGSRYVDPSGGTHGTDISAGINSAHDGTRHAKNKLHCDLCDLDCQWRDTTVDAILDRLVAAGENRIRLTLLAGLVDGRWR